MKHLRMIAWHLHGAAVAACSTVSREIIEEVKYEIAH